MGGIRIGRIAGFPVSVNWCVLVILWLFTWSLASTLPAAVLDYSKGGYWLAGTCGVTRPKRCHRASETRTYCSTDYRTPKCLGGSTDSADLS